jgi:uncharacterized membrane protein YfcA
MDVLANLHVPFTPEAFIYASAACVFAYIVLGVTGFGSSLILVVTLVQILPIREVIAQVVFLDLFGALYIGAKHFKDIEKKEFLWVILFNFVGLFIGLQLILEAPERPLLALLAIFVMVNGVSMLLRRSSIALPPCRRIWGVPTGLVGGIFSSLYGTGGPIFILYLARRLNQYRQIRATIASIIFVNVFVRAIGLTIAGLLITYENAVRSLVLIPFCYLGLRLGSKVHETLSPLAFKTILGGLLVSAALALVPKIT